MTEDNNKKQYSKAVELLSDYYHATKHVIDEDDADLRLLQREIEAALKFLKEDYRYRGFNA